MIREAIRRWQAGELTWEQLLEVVRRAPKIARPARPMAETIEDQWRNAEEEPHIPGTWDDLYVEWLAGTVTTAQFHQLEAALVGAK